MIKTIAWKVRIYPNKAQEVLINKTLGCSRFIYNQMLAEHMAAYEQFKDDKRSLYEYKYKTEAEYKQEYEWLKEVDSISLQQSRRDMSAAYSNFFKSLSGERAGKSEFPKFHKKGVKNSYRTMNSKVDYELRKLKLPIVGWINYRDPRTPVGRITSTTVSKTKTGKYFASVLFQTEVPDIQPLDIEEKLNSGLFVKGLDMSMDKFYVDENGTSPDYIRLYRKYEDRLAHLQRQVSHKQKGSNNRRKAQLRVNKIYEKIANSRKDFVEKQSRRLVDESDVIVLESLNMQNLAQTLRLGKSVNDLGWGEFTRRLQNKAEELGKIVIFADKWFASSKTCSVCGYVNHDLQLSDREWTCPQCGTTHQRDMNAGKNLREYGLSLILTGSERPVVPVETLESIKVDEAGIPLL